MPSHPAGTRIQPKIWNEDGQGYPGGSNLEHDIWEVTCPMCGDDLGPYDRQPEHIQKLRGPYYGSRDALTAAAKHAMGTSV
jgi:hypothetical protein